MSHHAPSDHHEHAQSHSTDTLPGNPYEDKYALFAALLPELNILLPAPNMEKCTLHQLTRALDRLDEYYDQQLRHPSSPEMSDYCFKRLQYSIALRRIILQEATTLEDQIPSTIHEQRSHLSQTLRPKNYGLFDINPDLL